MKSLFLSAVMTLGLSVALLPNLAFAEDSTEITSDQPLTNEGIDFDDNMEWAQWGHPSRSRVTCFARAPGGRTFSGTSHSVGQAQRIAMNRCISWSRHCRNTGCRRGW